MGETLEEWERDIAQHPYAPPEVVKISWRPGAPIPAHPPLRRPAGPGRPGGGGNRDCAAAAIHDPVAARRGGGWVRLFGFGLEKARSKVRTGPNRLTDWNDDWDWFVA